MKSNPKVTEFQKDCFANYLADIREAIPDFPNPYLYPDGNPIRAVVPVQTTINKIMLVGAFPSARFERRNGKLIPIGDNLAPFGPEHYFDGSEVRVQESTERLHEDYFPQLGINRYDLWITDIVKVYLYPEQHVANCQALFPSKTFVNTHKLFPKIAQASQGWFNGELEVCNPRLILTLGEVAAKVVAGPIAVLDGVIRELPYGNRHEVVHLAHPEIRRRNNDWDRRTVAQLDKLAKQVRTYL